MSSQLIEATQPLLMVPDQTNDLSLSALLDVLPEGISWLKPVYSSSNEVVNFKFVYVNDIIRTQSRKSGFPLEPGELFLNSTQVRPAYFQKHFDLLVQVLQSGVSQTYTHFNEVLDGWYSITHQPMNGGVLSVARNVSEQIQSDRAMAAQTAHLQAVIDHSQTGIFVFSPVFDDNGAQIIDFRFKTINRMVAALVGQTPDRLIGAVASEWFISYRETGLFDHYLHTYLTGESQRFDINYNVDGFDVWFDVQSVRLDEDVLVTFTDYTLLKHAQQNIEQQAAQTRKQTELLNRILDSSESGIMAFEAIRHEVTNAIVDFRFLIINKACNAILNMPVDNLTGERLYTVFPGNWETGLFDLYVNTTETGEPGRREVYYKHDGLDIWLTISAQQLGDGFVVTFNDVTALKLANRAIEDAASELTTVIDTSQTGIFLFTPVLNGLKEIVDFRFKVANKQLGTYVGQEPTAIIGELGSQWFPDYLNNGLFNKYRDVYVTGQTHRFDFHYDGGGIDAWLDIMVTKMGDAILVTFTDYTALKKLQHQLEQTIDELKRSNANLEQFAYVASHDLQEPLRKIQSFGDVLQHKYSGILEEEGVGLITRMQVAANRMSGLIRDLLAYSRLATRTDNVRTVSLPHVLARVLDDLDMSVQETAAVIHAGHLPVVTGDEMQLRQLFQNLLSNALKFKPLNSHPIIRIVSQRITADALPVGVVPIRTSMYYECIELTDNGIGFDQKYVDRIFQVFQRLHGRSQYEGTGIGLAIVQKVVENHGGAVTATSQPGQGATFAIYLPVEI
ncbi:PAS domain-containing sensor histidine kinase [Fibrella aquatica]|uniref:PAS domain-containing sensor histidine kinase n=1 Tax=Fibrella aquatica TaxID=3242487 RepID=UPI0035215DFE